MPTERPAPSPMSESPEDAAHATEHRVWRPAGQPVARPLAQPDRRSGTSLRGLLALNIGLLGVLGLVVLPPAADGQPAGTRNRGDYTMVGGAVTGGTANAIWVLDAANEELIAIRWNDSRSRLEGLGYRNLADDAKAMPGR